MGSKGKISEIVDVAACEAQLTALNKGLSVVLGTIEQVSKQAVTMSTAFKEAKGLKDVKISTEQLNKVEQEKLIAGEKLKQQLIATEKAQLALTTAQQKAADKVKAETTEYQKLQSAYKEATAKAREMLLTYGKADERTKQAVKTQQELDKKLKETNQILGQHQADVGKYGKVWEGVTGTIAIFTATYAALSGVISFGKSVIESTGESTKRWKIETTGLTWAWDEFKRSIATGDFKSFFSNMESAYKAGREYAAALSDISKTTRAATVENAQLNVEFQKQKVIERDVMLSKSERIEAGKKALEIEEQMMKNDMLVSQKKYDAEMLNIRTITRLNDEQIQQAVITYNKNKENLDLANAYNKAQSDLSAIMSAGGGASTFEEQDRLKKIIKETSPEVITLAGVMKAMGKSTGEDLDKLTEAWKRVYDVEAESVQKTARIKVTLSKLLKGELNDEVKDEKDAKTEHDKVLQEKRDADKFYAESFKKTVSELQAFQKKSGAIFDNEADKKAWDELNKKAILYIQVMEKLRNGGQLTQAKDTVFHDKNKKIDLIDSGDGGLGDFIDQTDAEIELATFKKDKLIELGQETFDRLNELSNAKFERELSALDLAAKADEDAKARELKQAGNNAALKSQIEDKYLKKEKEREAERIKIKMKQDKANKEAAMIKIAIDTARGIVAALADPATALWLPEIIAAEGLIQLATVAATPLPKYFKGREDGPAEMALVGERGTEAIKLNDGSMYLTPNRPTVTFLPEHAQVISNEKLMDAVTRSTLGNFAGIQASNNQHGNDFNVEKIVQAIKNKKEYHINITEKGLQAAAFRGASITQYLNKNVRI